LARRRYVLHGPYARWGGWTLPSQSQLEGLLLTAIDSASNCYISGCAFLAASCATDWTSTLVTGHPDEVYVMGFGSGVDTDFVSENSTFRVRCVR
jgi:hypothetical protein